MKIDVFDTYVRAKNGALIHFDVLLESGATQEQALAYARQFLLEIGESVDALKSERCNFCHTESASPEVEAEIQRSSHSILQMEGCPHPYR